VPLVGSWAALGGFEFAVKGLGAEARRVGVPGSGSRCRMKPGPGDRGHASARVDADRARAKLPGVESKP